MLCRILVNVVLNSTGFFLPCDLDFHLARHLHDDVDGQTKFVCITFVLHIDVTDSRTKPALRSHRGRNLVASETTRARLSTALSLSILFIDETCQRNQYSINRSIVSRVVGLSSPGAELSRLHGYSLRLTCEQ